SEVAEGLHRSMQARLVGPEKREVFRTSLLEFLTHGIKYVFPVHPGAVVRGIPTAHSATPLKNKVMAEEEKYVWPSERGHMKGQSITPLYPSVLKAVEVDEKLYELLALIDALRAGRAREQKIAVEELKNRLYGDSYQQQEAGIATDGRPRIW
ncbi:MAG: hypothetical protein AAF804_09745, partial [Bacteroidota bacterium]